MHSHAYNLRTPCTPVPIILGHYAPHAYNLRTPCTPMPIILHQFHKNITKMPKYTIAAIKFSCTTMIFHLCSCLHKYYMLEMKPLLAFSNIPPFLSSNAMVLLTQSMADSDRYQLAVKLPLSVPVSHKNQHSQNFCSIIRRYVAPLF